MRWDDKSYPLIFKLNSTIRPINLLENYAEWDSMDTIFQKLICGKHTHSWKCKEWLWPPPSGMYINDYLVILRKQWWIKSYLTVDTAGAIPTKEVEKEFLIGQA